MRFYANARAEVLLGYCQACITTLHRLSLPNQTSLMPLMIL
jgi:hypothetical protein